MIVIILATKIFKNIYVDNVWYTLLVSILLLAVIIKVFYIQVFQYKKLNNLANNLWSRELPITADRGLIVDRNNKVLASNITTTSLYIVVKATYRCFLSLFMLLYFR